MPVEMGCGKNKKSLADPFYTSGEYFTDVRKYSADARFKADRFVQIFSRFVKRNALTVNSLVDVGCGSGDIVKLIADSLRAGEWRSIQFKAYDVSPHVLEIHNEGIEYIHGDFCLSDEWVDVVTLFDVFEHVPDPIQFLKRTAERCKIMVFHIPLENSFNIAMRNLFGFKMKQSGHLIFLDVVSALNLLAFAGLRVVEYEYTFAFLAPRSRKSLRAKLVFPVRCLIAKISPWLLSKTTGGASLLVIALTPRLWREGTILR